MTIAFCLAVLLLAPSQQAEKSIEGNWKLYMVLYAGVVRDEEETGTKKAIVIKDGRFTDINKDIPTGSGVCKSIEGTKHAFDLIAEHPNGSTTTLKVLLKIDGAGMLRMARKAEVHGDRPTELHFNKTDPNKYVFIFRRNDAK